MQHHVFIAGVALWSPQLPGWEAARAILRGDRSPDPDAATRPAATLLAPTERRRAPDSVAVALEVAASACQDAQLDPARLSSVFASTHGDLAVTDSLCETLAKAPQLTSPTKFHNSVHNAAAGYWTIGSKCLRPYTAVSAWHHTFAAGLLEATSQAIVQQEPILYVAYDIAARGPLSTMAQSGSLLAAALVLAPDYSSAATTRMTWSTRPSASPTLSVSRPTNEALVAGNAMAGCLPLFEALATNQACELTYAAAPRLELALALQPVRAETRAA
ncbi:MAG: beta-ketoacyl synthase chain length factor [Pseudomonadales bacterium]|nr:beta-ketoacyl synthase chain length factor [Pseudomonadales bacterium]